ncbi:phospholipase A1 superfamily [Prevotella sp. CAG:1031]|nr:phospholipase A1 superfamily [Prevotella sp. CAG:1031]
MTRLLRLIATVFLGAVSMAAGAQIVTDSLERVDTDSVRRAFDRGPYFGLYKDNYFIFGTSVNHTPTKTNTDIKFQISIQQRLTRSTLPFGTYLYLFYSQKCWWNVLENSMPMVDLNFNPGIGLAKPLFVKNRYVGKVTLMAEHESNGRDGLASRSWNKISLAASIMIDPQVTVHGKVWIPIVDGQNNRDILDYSGIYQVGTEFTSRNRRFTASVVLVKRRGWKLNYNTIIELGYRIFRRDNQFLFLQFYNGYGECMLDYNQFRSRVRVGIVIKPRLFSEY